MRPSVPAWISRAAILIGIVLFASTAVVIANLLVDICYAVLDPRVRLS